MSKRFSKTGWIIIVALLCLALPVFPACTTEGGGGGGGGNNQTLPSTYIGSGQLDGNGIPVDFFSDINVRKGFCYAFDYETYLQDALNGQGVQIGSPIVDGLYGFDPNSPKYTYDADMATQYFKLAYNGQVWEKGFKFTVLYNVGNLARLTACQILQQDLFKINPLFEVDIAALAWPNMLQKIFGTRDMPLFQIGWLADYPHADDFVEPFMNTHGAFSEWQAYGNAALDAQLKAALQELDTAKQLQDYQDLAKKYYDDAPAIMLAQPAVNRYMSPFIHGYVYNVMENWNGGHLINLTKANDVTGLPAGSPTYQNNGIYVGETIGDAASLDPAWIYDTSSGALVNLIYDTLIYFHADQTGEFDGLLADNWTFDDATATWTFHLRADQKFSNGDTVTASDVKYSIFRAMILDRPGGPMWMLYGALLDGSGSGDYSSVTDEFNAIDATMTVIDPQTIAFHLAGAYWKLPFMQIMCGGWAGIVDESYVQGLGGWDGTANGITAVQHPATADATVLYDAPVGSGPWMLSNWDHGVSTTLTKNPNYTRTTVPFNTVIFKVVDEWTDRKLDLQSGAADYVDVPAANYPDMDTAPGIQSFKLLPTLECDAIFFNFLIGGPSS